MNKICLEVKEKGSCDSRGLKMLTAGFLILFGLIINSVAQDPDSLELYFNQYRFDQVIQCLSGREDGNLATGDLVYRAASLKALRKYELALLAYEELLRRDTAQIKIILDLSGTYKELGNYIKTIELLEYGLQLEDSNDYIRTELGDACFTDNRYRKAIDHYQYIFHRDTSFYLARQLARSYEGIDEKDSAIAYYRIALSYNASDFLSTYRLADIYRDMEEYPEGMALTDTFLLHDPENIRMLKLSGYLHYLSQDYEISSHQFTRCHVLGDQSDFINKYLGYSYFRLKEFEKAKDFLEKAFENDTLNANLCYALGVSCYSSVYKKSGIDYLNKCLELLEPSPEFVSLVYQDLGAAYTGYYQYEDAFDAYFQALKLTPSDTLLVFKMASHCDNFLNDKHLAIRYYEKFMETRSGKKESFPRMPLPGQLVISYYDYAERRLRELKEELFWEGEKPDSIFNN